METTQLKARLALLDMMLSKMNGSQIRMLHLKRTVFVLRAILNEQGEIRSAYGPETGIAQFSLQ